jgi:hypothetical protein
MELKLAINACGVDYPYYIPLVSEIRPAQKQISLQRVHGHFALTKSTLSCTIGTQLAALGEALFSPYTEQWLL